MLVLIHQNKVRLLNCYFTATVRRWLAEEYLVLYSRHSLLERLSNCPVQSSNQEEALTFWSRFKVSVSFYHFVLMIFSGLYRSCENIT